MKLTEVSVPWLRRTTPLSVSTTAFASCSLGQPWPQTSHRRAKAYLQHVAARRVVHARPRVRVLLGREETPLHFGWVRACLQTEPQTAGRYLADWQKMGRAEPEAFLEGGPRGEHGGQGCCSVIRRAMN